jgi:serine protease Do
MARAACRQRSGSNGFLLGCRRASALLFAAGLALLAGSTGVASADGGRPSANPEERAAAMIRPAVMYLVGEAYGRVWLPGGRPLSQFGEGSTMPYAVAWTCTGFVVNPDGWVATAGHCVDPASAADLILRQAANDFKEQFPDAPQTRNPAGPIAWLRENARVEGTTAGQGLETSITVMYGTGTKVAGKMPANVVDFQPIKKGDVALIKVEKHNMPSSELGTEAKVDIGTPILAVGFAESTTRVTGRSLDPTNKSGKVSKKSTMGTVLEYEIDAAITEGMSGGPAVELDGRVVGLNSFAPSGEPQPFNFVAPVDHLAAMLVGKGVEAKLGPADVSYRKGLQRYHSGRYTDAIADFDQTLSISPDYPGLVDLKASAVVLRTQYGDASLLGGSRLLWFIVGGAATIVAAGGAATFMVLRRRRLAPSGPAGLEPAAVVPPATGDATGQPVRLQVVVPAQPAAAAATEPHFCANCGAEHHPAEKFCPNCGHRIPLGESA